MGIDEFSATGKIAVTTDGGKFLFEDCRLQGFFLIDGKVCLFHLNPSEDDTLLGHFDVGWSDKFRELLSQLNITSWEQLLPVYEKGLFDREEFASFKKEILDVFSEVGLQLPKVAIKEEDILIDDLDLPQQIWRDITELFNANKVGDLWVDRDRKRKIYNELGSEQYSGLISFLRSRSCLKTASHLEDVPLA